MPVPPFVRLGPEDGGNFEFHWMNGYLEAHFISDVGKKRQHNEDSCILCLPEDDAMVAHRGRLFAVADGMGGASAGEFASRLALTTITEEYYAGEAPNLPEHLRGAIERANERVFNEAINNPAYEGMGTTATSLLVRGDCAYIGQVGDSRVYLSRTNMDLYQVTKDHSLVAEQVRAGIISEEEAKNHALKNLITRAIGIKAEVQIDLFCFRLKKGDTMLICSDGLNNMVDDVDVGPGMQMEHLQGAARLLVGKALEGGGTDNVSVGLIRVTDTPPATEMHDGCDVIELPASGFLGKLKKLFS